MLQTILAGCKLSIYSDTSNPARVGGLESYGQVSDSVIDGDYLYLGRKYGVEIVNIASPTNPGSVSFTDTGFDEEVFRIEKQGSYLYLGIGEDNPKLAVYNATNVNNPIRTGELAITGANKLDYLKINGNYGYGGIDDVFYVFDISDPANPAQATSLTDTEGVALAIGGNYAYLLHQDGLTVIDISTPTSPRKANTIPLGGDAGYIGKDLAIQGEYAYIVGYSYSDGSYSYAEGLISYDLSTPETPVQVGRFNERLNNIRLEGNYAYCLYYYINYVFDISDPTEMLLVAIIIMATLFLTVMMSPTVAYM